MAEYGPDHTGWITRREREGVIRNERMEKDSQRLAEMFG